MSVAPRFVLSLAALSAVGVGVWIGCQPAETAGPSAIDAGPANLVSYCGEAGAPCCGHAVQGLVVPPLLPGETPNPKCDDGDETQCNSSTSCPITETPTATMPNGCGSIAPTSCEPLAQNPPSGVQNFRMRRLILVAPTALANTPTQNGVINVGVNMNEPQCGELQSGTFSWLLSFDTDAGTLTTGGAPACDNTNAVPCDPYTTGYCFVNKNVPTPTGTIPVGPITVNTVVAADGTIQTAPIPTLNIPIYDPTTGSIIVLPIHGGSLRGVSISDNGNCIGSINVNALSASCSDNYETCSKWLTAGALTGYITLQEANNVEILINAETLCSLLTGDKNGPTLTASNGATIATCKLDANGNVTDPNDTPGDYCSKNPDGGAGGSPTGCTDSAWLAATFAASAVNINDGTGVPDCLGGAVSEDSGTPPVDSGTDTGSPTDAGAD